MKLYVIPDEFMFFAAFSAQSHGTGISLAKVFDPGGAPLPGVTTILDHQIEPDGIASYAVYVDPFWTVTLQCVNDCAADTGWQLMDNLQGF